MIVSVLSESSGSFDVLELRANVAYDLLGVLNVVDGAANTGNAGDGSAGNTNGSGGDAERIHCLV